VSFSNRYTVWPCPSVMIDPSDVWPTVMAEPAAGGAGAGGAVVVGLAPYPLPPVAVGREVEAPQPVAINPAAANPNGTVATHRRVRMNLNDRLCIPGVRAEPLLQFLRRAKLDALLAGPRCYPSASPVALNAFSTPRRALST
jgi:hypothetical protein